MKNFIAYFGLAAIIILAYLMIAQHSGSPAPAGAQPAAATATVIPAPAGAGTSIYSPPGILVKQINTILALLSLTCNWQRSSNLSIANFPLFFSDDLFLNQCLF